MSTPQRIYKKGEFTKRDLASRHHDPYEHLPTAAREAQKQRDDLGRRIQVITNRLAFGYSEPLYRYKMSLIKEDMDLVSQITTILIESKST